VTELETNCGCTDNEKDEVQNDENFLNVKK